jgi:transglutaminase-like putative cysteine protease
MQLRIVHETRYDYATPVESAQHLAFVQPRDTPAQRVLSHRLLLAPPVADVHHTQDVWGNHRAHWALLTPHRQLIITADSTVATRQTRLMPTTCKALGWESARERFVYAAGGPYEPASEFVFPSPLVPCHELLADRAREAFTPNRSLPEAAIALMAQLHTTLQYRPQSTQVNPPVLEALERGEGVCQDFAHILVGCLRSLGLAARYVSGYLLTHPPHGVARMLGADASHAWASAYIPGLSDDPEDSWLDLDPTNNRWGWASPGEDYVCVATGRDYADVCPVRGVIQGGAQHRLGVAVTVAPVNDWPEPDPPSATPLADNAVA